MDLSDFSHVIFDLDGVLLDTEKLYTEATQKVVGEFGKTFDWSLKSQMMGRHELEAAALLVETLELPISARRVFETPVAHRRGAVPVCHGGSGSGGVRHHARGARPCVGGGHQQHAALVSAQDRSPELVFRLRRSGFRGSSGGACAQAGTRHLSSTLRRAVAGDPARCLVVEDSPAGVLAARAAGMSVVAIPDAALSASRFEAADLIVRSYAELRERLNC